MTRLLRWSSSLYQGMLCLYPEDLRRDYRQEMTLVFSEDLAASWDSSGVLGVVQVWYSAILEFVQLALPALAATPSAIVPAASFLLAALSLGGELMLARQAAAASGECPPLHEAICAVVLWPSVVAALVSLTAVRITARRRPVSLQLYPMLLGLQASKRDR